MPLPFRQRIFVILVALTAVPTALAVVGWALAVRTVAPSAGARVALEEMAASARLMVDRMDTTHLSVRERAAFREHLEQLSNSVTLARRAETYLRYYAGGFAAVVFVLGAFAVIAAVRVAGHLSRQLSRPIDELVGWTRLIRRRMPLPAGPPTRGAPEFEALRQALRELATALDAARERELEAERLRAFREVARRVAHEIKNPLTAMRIAVDQLRRSGGPVERRTDVAVEVIGAETERLDQLAKEFSEFGRLPEGPRSEVDLVDLLMDLGKSAVPSEVDVSVRANGEPCKLLGHYDPLRRAFANLLRNAAEAMGGRGSIETAEAANGSAGIAAVERDAPDAVLLDLMMPGGPDGLATLEHLKRVAPDLPVVMMSGKANLADAVRATKLGAFQFLEKPLTPEGLLTTLRAALELSRTLAENRRLHEALGHADPLVGVSKAMDQLRGLIARVAPTEARVLITGESGTGKELVASAIHRQSGRAAKPFVCVNSAAIPKDLVESEMFGHERGAFTGATERRVGRFELADSGTLFLDEVGDLSPEAQAKLLRVLESGVIERLGGEKPVTVDVRVIAATNKDLAKASQQGQFRDDLLFRLNVLPIHIPPLRERPDDIPPLVQHFAARQATRLGRSVQFDAGAVQLLASYAWPGNVRELANIMERLVILAGGDVVTADDVARVVPGDGGSPSTTAGEGWSDVALAEALDGFERTLIARALSAARGTVAEEARNLATDRANLYRRMRRLGLEPPRNVAG